MTIDEELEAMRARLGDDVQVRAVIQLIFTKLTYEHEGTPKMIVSTILPSGDEDMMNARVSNAEQSARAIHQEAAERTKLLNAYRQKTGIDPVTGEPVK